MAACVRMNKLKEKIQLKNKNIFTSTTHWMCAVVMKEDKKNYCGKCFQSVRYRDYENLSNKKTPAECSKVLNA